MGVNGLQGTRNLHHITPEKILGDMQAEGTGKARWMRKVSLSERFGERMIVGDKDQGTVAEAGICECQMNCDYITASYGFPIHLHIADGCLVRFIR